MPPLSNRPLLLFLSYFEQLLSSDVMPSFFSLSSPIVTFFLIFFFFNDPPPPEIYPLPLHAPLPISSSSQLAPALHPGAPLTFHAAAIVSRRSLWSGTYVEYPVTPIMTRSRDFRHTCRSTGFGARL